MCAIGSYSVPVIGSCPSSFILLIKTTTRTKLRRRKNEAHTFPPRGLMPTLGLSVCFCSDSASGREWNQTQEATRKYGILRIHMYGWHSSIFMNNLWGIMAAATFCEQRGEKRDWNLNRIDAPHPIITPLNSCLSDITRGIFFDGTYLGGAVNIKRQNAKTVPNIKFKSSKISSDRYLQLQNGEIVTSTNTPPKLQLLLNQEQTWQKSAHKTVTSIESIHVLLFALGTCRLLTKTWH